MPKPNSTYLHARLPNEVWQTPPKPSELAILAYVIRHQFGKPDNEVRLTDDEFAHGRHKRGGTRMDGGCGLRGRNSLKKARAALIARNWLTVREDASDKARLRRLYKVNIQAITGTVSESDTPVSESDTPVSESDTPVSVSDSRSHSITSQDNFKDNSKGEARRARTEPSRTSAHHQNGNGDGKSAAGSGSPGGRSGGSPPSPADTLHPAIKTEDWLSVAGWMMQGSDKKPAKWDADDAERMARQLGWPDCTVSFAATNLQNWRWRYVHLQNGKPVTKVERVLDAFAACRTAIDWEAQ